jgi:MSHA biogenesis protein MshK
MVGRMIHNANRGRPPAEGFSSIVLQPAFLAFAVWWVASCLAVPCALAQVLNDPTRPAAGVYSSESTDAAAAGPVLQSVMITPTARSAIIGGEVVKLGAKYGDARIIKITESEVVLRSSTGIETLKMYPGVDMKPVKLPVTTTQKSVSKSSKTGKLPARNGNEK